MNYLPRIALVFDCESVGLYGETYAVAGAVYDFTKPFGPERVSQEFVFACEPENAIGDDDDRQWCLENIPPIKVHIKNASPTTVRKSFGEFYEGLKDEWPTIGFAAECLYPVEANFISSCVKQGFIGKFEGPYPFHEIASFMAAAGMDPMANYERLSNELPKHDPMADVRQSARLLHKAIWILKGNK